MNCAAFPSTTFLTLLEYIGEIPAEQRQLVLSQLNEQTNLLISDKALSQVLVTVGRDGMSVLVPRVLPWLQCASRQHML